MTVSSEPIDVIVAGGGPAGMAAAMAFASLGHSVLCADPAPPVTDRDAKGADLRSTAFLQPSRDFLEEVGLWQRVAAEASELQIMRIVDAGGAKNEPRQTCTFDASDIGERPFGWNLPNWLLKREFRAAVSDHPLIDMRSGVSVTQVLSRTREAQVTLSDGARFRTQLVVGADGRNSTVRRTAGIGVRTQRFGQKALAFAVTHADPHLNVSTEIHRSGGPFTLVPLPDYAGKPSSAVVWMERGPEALRLKNLSVPDFTEAMNSRSCNILGPLELASHRTLWPIISQIADRFSAEHVALVAEAAHVVPPIGAQGLNMSLADISTLYQIAAQAPDSVGSLKMLENYNRQRWLEARGRVSAVDLLNRASMVDTQPLRDLRLAGLRTLYGVPSLRKTAMKAGLGASA